MIGSVPWDVNYIAVLAATVVGMIIGAVYYQPAVAGKAWMASTGRTMEQVQAAGGAMIYVITAALTLINAAVLAAVIGWAGATGIVGGALIGAILWLGITLTAVAMTFLFEGRGMNSIVITGGHHLILNVVMGAIIGWWPW